MSRFRRPPVSPPPAFPAGRPPDRGRPLSRGRSVGLLLLAVLAAVAALGGCGAPLVHPWDRDLLAQKPMSFDPLPLMSSADDHIYFSTEGSTGGQNVSGGGCGCN